MATQAGDVIDPKKIEEAFNEFKDSWHPDAKKLVEDVIETVGTPITEVFNTSVETPGLLVRAYAFGVITGILAVVISTALIKLLG